ncbi:hypothetical protein WV31_05540 [Magnetospirillum sp. ME-1]|nr:hypothetical protein WV31_05540 [Magnetospirillum sp. ME-1]
MPRLTKQFVNRILAEPEAKDRTYLDESLSGFGLRVQGTAASWIIMYRTHEGRQRKVTLAKVGTLTPDEARSLAREKLAEAAKGGDPASDKTAAREAMTVAQVCTWYLEQAEKGALLGRHGRKIKDWTLYQDRSRINTHVVPLLGAKKVDSLSLADIERFQADIVAGKSAKARTGRGSATRGGIGAASRVVGMLQTIFEHAKRARQIKANPADGVKKHADGKQRRFLSLDEITALGEAMRAAPDESPTAIAAIRFLLLTGLRRNEALSLPWNWIDTKARCIRFDDTKSGAQLRPIGADAVALLEELKRREGSPWVFPAERGEGHYIGLPKALGRICERAGLEGVTIHVLRHSFAATAAAMDYSELTIAGLLGHTLASVTARYAHVPDRALVNAADAVSEQISAALEGRISA